MAQQQGQQQEVQQQVGCAQLGVVQQLLQVNAQREVEQGLAEELGDALKELKWLKRSHKSLRREVAAGLDRVWEVENVLAQTAVDMEGLLWYHHDEMDNHGKMQMFIRWDGHTVLLGVDAHQSVFSVKSQLLDREGVPVDRSPVGRWPFPELLRDTGGIHVAAGATLAGRYATALFGPQSDA